ncbi:hypothetical protein LIER_18245 [Lithospermum erythrorhizon]|uniref:Reverse transcriptase zinc-binding domain-containing protein n=1 Tax=Lithospermum erythrorhizon TaxID=34254 RepID=A0AAV3QEK1_LITER
MYNQLRRCKEKVKWKNLVWHQSNVPRHSFITWLLLQGRLETKDRVRKWLPGVDMKCVFCQEEESQGHLFFECEYRCVEESVEYGKPVKVTGKLQGLLLRLGFCATVYMVWQERNRRFHGKGSREQVAVWKRVVEDVVDRVRVCKGFKKTKLLRISLNVG